MVPSKQTHHQNSTKFLQFKNNFLYFLVSICHLYCDIAQMIKRLHFQEITPLLQRKKKCIWLSWNSQNAHNLLHLLLQIILRACAARGDIFQRMNEFWGGFVKNIFDATVLWKRKTYDWLKPTVKQLDSVSTTPVRLCALLLFEWVEWSVCQSSGDRGKTCVELNWIITQLLLLQQ